ncbi:hypothetical protein OIDMADRAFT_38010 [Oidiodendron maius Zn]|uniref:Uncharacterized protein n=1 Tax=Oidiodendron maius (strain Zn) TaxID=913774 RepID=A0A0C3DCU1_OIDMZ|nr:hypothetical protein OIDMADRAFT_38010 [Oidiodendron maius Zn]
MIHLDRSHGHLVTLLLLPIALAPAVESIQPLLGEPFIGGPREPNLLRPKDKYNQFTLAYHRDTGNTRSDDYLSPLGEEIKTLSTSQIKPAPLYWDDEGRLTAGAICNDTTTCIVALDRDTFNVTATWTGPTEHGSVPYFPFFTYSTVYYGRRYVTPALGPRILEVERIDNEQETSFKVFRDLDLSSIVGNNSQIINSQYDADGNLWFTTGGFSGVGLGSASTTAVVGYVEPAGVIRHIGLPGSTIENGIAMSGSTVYLATGPAGDNDHPNAVGYLYALEPSSEGVRILYTEKYDAGDGIKLGGISRGSGSSPSLLGNEYVTIIDNANERINLLFFRQANSPSNSSNLLCKVPLFSPNASANENTLGSHFNGDTYSVIVTNSFNAPPPINFFNSTTTINSSAHKVTNAGPGFARIDPNPQSGERGTRWEADLRATGIPTLSTASGPLYQYSQGHDLARNGSYVWYVSGVDYETGEIVFRIRTGAGPLFNNNYQSPTLGPDGAVYTWVQGGIVKVYDM